MAEEDRTQEKQNPVGRPLQADNSDKRPYDGPEAVVQRRHFDVDRDAPARQLRVIGDEVRQRYRTASRIQSRPCTTRNRRTSKTPT
jgi:hypothetical protein